MENSQKKLLVLAGAGVHSKVVETARQMGIYTIVADFLPYSPAKSIADEALELNIFDIDRLCDYCKDNEVDGVINFCIDPAQRPAFQIANRLGLPVFGDERQVHILTDKVSFKAFCRENNVDVIPEYTLEEVEKGLVEYPILVKPTDSRGSRGITVCRNMDQVKAAVELAIPESSTGEYIIEKYMENNQDLTISYIVKDGEPVLFSLGDRNSGRVEDNLNRQLICTIQPSRYIDMYMKYVDERVVNMIKNLGIKNGPVFMQGFVDGNTVRMYDPGIRYPGNEYERIFAKATGINPMKSLISYIVGGEILDYNGGYVGSYMLNGKRAIQYMINVGPGIIGRFDGLDKIAEHPNIIDVQQRHFVGTKVENTGDIRHRAGEISILVDDNKDKMFEVIKFIQNNLIIENIEGESMIISPFEPSRVYDMY